MKLLKMTGMMAFVLTANLITLLVLASFLGIKPGAAGPVTPTCGDVTGDGSVQLNDAVVLLNYLFANGPEPVCAQEPLDLSQLEGVLAKFFPRGEDYYYEEVVVPAQSQVVALTVPPGRTFLLTHYVGDAQVLRNDEPSLSDNTAWGGSNRASQFPIAFPFYAGDTLTFETGGQAMTMRFFGYFTDAN